MDESGRLETTGRSEDAIIRDGENIYPHEIEEMLRIHPGISDAQVYGIPDESHGEQVAAAVRKWPGGALTTQGVRAAGGSSSRLRGRPHRR